MCYNMYLTAHKERQRRKKNTLMLKKLKAKLTPNDPPSPIGSEGQESEPETFEQIWDKAQKANYWDRAFGTSSYYDPTYGGMQGGRGSSAGDPFLGTSTPHPSTDDPNIRTAAEQLSSMVTGVPPCPPPMGDTRDDIGDVCLILNLLRTRRS
jgi:hypothetical protein